MAKRATPVVTKLPDKALIELRARARAVGVAAIDQLAELALGAESDSVKLAAIKELLDRGFGRPAAAPASDGAGGLVDFLMVDDGYAG